MTASSTIEDSAESTVQVKTFADWLVLLAVPPERIWTTPAPGTATEADAIYADEHLDRLCELVDGTLVEKAMGSQESLLAGIIISILNAFVLPRRMGFVLAPDGMFRLFAGRIRMPDVSFISLSRLPDGVRQSVLGAAPELAIEILSEGNTLKEMKSKRKEYFSSGVKIVWIVDPDARTVRVYSEPEVFSEYQNDRVLDGGDVLPGFTVRTSDLFTSLDLHV